MATAPRPPASTDDGIIDRLRARPASTSMRRLAREAADIIEELRTTNTQLAATVAVLSHEVEHLRRPE